MELLEKNIDYIASGIETFLMAICKIWCRYTDPEVCARNLSLTFIGVFITSMMLLTVYAVVENPRNAYFERASRVLVEN